MTQTSISYATVLYELKTDREAVETTRQILREVPQVQKALRIRGFLWRRSIVWWRGSSRKTCRTF